MGPGPMGLGPWALAYGPWPMGQGLWAKANPKYDHIWAQFPGVGKNGAQGSVVDLVTTRMAASLPNSDNLSGRPRPRNLLARRHPKAIEGSAMPRHKNAY